MPSPPLTQAIIPVVQPIRFLEPKLRSRIRAIELADPYPFVIQSQAKVDADELLAIPVGVRSRSRVTVQALESLIAQSRARVTFEDLGPFSLTARSRGRAAIFDALAARSRARIRSADVARVRSRSRVSMVESIPQTPTARWLFDSDPWVDTIGGLTLTRASGNPADPSIVSDGGNVTQWDNSFNPLQRDGTSLAVQTGAGNYKWRCTFEIKIVNNPNFGGTFLEWNGEWFFSYFSDQFRAGVNNDFYADQVTSSVTVATGVWYSILIEYTGTQIRLQVNTTTNTAPITAGISPKTPSLISFGSNVAGQTRLRNFEFYRLELV